MNPTAILNKIAKLLESENFKLRIATIAVIAELRLSSRMVLKNLGHCLEEDDEELQLAALDAMTRLKAQEVKSIVPLVLTAGPVREQAVRLLEEIGQPVVPHLIKLYESADFHGKRAIVSTLAKVASKKSLAFLVSILPSESFDLQKHLTVQIGEGLDRLSANAQSAVFSTISRLTKPEPKVSSAQLLMSGAILLGHFRSPALAVRARQSLRRLCESNCPPEVRRHAMVSFSRLIEESKLASNEIQFVEKMLCDEDWYNVAQYALGMFQRVDVPKKRLLDLVPLLRKSPHFSVHIHVFGRLENSDRSEVAQAILPFLSDDRFRVREAAQEALKQIPSGIDSLFGLLMQTTDVEVTQRVNTVLRDFPLATQKKYVSKACQRLLSLYEQNDAHYAPFLEFVRTVDPEPLRRMVYEKAWALKGRRSRDKWSRIAAYLTLLWENHLINPEGRYLLGVASLRLNSKELAPAARRDDLGLKVLRALVYDDGEGFVKRLRADKDLTAADFYYLGFHFSEEGGDMRPFGMAMLKHVVKRYPRDKVAEAAQRKLKLQSSLQEKEDAAARDAKAREAAKARSSSERAKSGRRTAAAGSTSREQPAKASAAVAKTSSADKKSVAAKNKAAKAKAKKKAPAKKKAGKKVTGKKSVAKKRSGKKKSTQRPAKAKGKSKAVSKKKPAAQKRKKRAAASALSRTRR